MLPLVSLTLFLPLVGALIILMMPAGRTRLIHATAIATAAATLIGAFGLWIRGLGSTTFSQVEQVSWIPSIGAAYKVGLDGISLPLVVMTAILFFVGLCYSSNVKKNPKVFTTLLLFLETASLGVFLALDMLLFYVFFELTLVGMYFIISGWGHGKQAKRAALLFFLYTLLGSLPLLLAILALFLGSDPRTFDMVAIIANPPLTGGMALFAFLAIVISFGVKTPVVPFHSWLPVAHVEAPTVGSIILAGVMLKTGTYGFIRFALQMTPDVFAALGWLIVAIGVLSVIYGAFAALAQTDLKRLVAYTSINHMGYVIMAIGAAAVTTDQALRAVALDGAVLQMISHGFVTGLLFLLVGMLKERTGTRDLTEMKGLLLAAPVLAGLFVYAAFASLGLPGLAHFPAEFQAFLGTFAIYPLAAFIAIFGILITAGVYLRAIRMAFFGRPRSAVIDNKISLREWSAILPLAVLTVVLGILPSIVLNTVHITTLMIGK